MGQLANLLLVHAPRPIGCKAEQEPSHHVSFAPALVPCLSQALHYDGQAHATFPHPFILRTTIAITGPNSFSQDLQVHNSGACMRVCHPRLRLLRLAVSQQQLCEEPLGRRHCAL